MPVDNTVDMVEPTGANTYLVSEIADAEVVSRISAELQIEAGFAFDPQTELGIL